MQGSPASTSGSSVAQYYVAVGSQEAKLGTLLELLSAISSAPREWGKRICISCSSRDTLDEVVHALIQAQAFDVSALHADLTEKEVELMLSQLIRSTQLSVASTEVASSGQTRIIVTTDASLKAFLKDSALQVPLLIQYDIPRGSKEAYQRRVAVAFGTGKTRRRGQQRCVVVNMTSADELAVFRAYEKLFAAGTIQELPVHAIDIFG